MRRFAIILVGLAACGPAATRAAGPPVTPADDLLGRVEASLTDAKTVEIHVRSHADGALAADVEGTILLEGKDKARLDFRGRFAGQDAELHWLADGKTSTGGGPVPPGLREAIVVGFLRMGALHNVARLVGGEGPDHAAGGAKSWVVAKDVKNGAPAPGSERELDYVIVVDGKASGEARVWVDEPLALPLRREVTVHFPEGDMHVREDYEIKLDEPLPDGSFAP